MSEGKVIKPPESHVSKLYNFSYRVGVEFEAIVVRIGFKIHMGSFWIVNWRLPVDSLDGDCFNVLPYDYRVR